ncbi:restriction endonuclease [Pseudomonas resinovorans]|uniref:restriction endonuclease n=1 Tax=Metapseudomonas resinovorans TaxID=53412 RepID=UPI00237EF579|nr:restriction endonuclease [Pseudomonas resinovorans]MDE3735912.1 restriction endonuclease [Pseudomonas resinovorans]
MKIFPYQLLSQCDLVVDAIYESSGDGQIGGEPISKILPGSGNMGGFRVSGRGERKNWVVLFSTGEDRDWPDTLDLNTGRFVYYGDNKTPGHELHDTRAGGNKVLRAAFTRLHDDAGSRADVSPFFVFKKMPTENGARSVQFKGLAVPGYPGLSATEDLVAVWKSSKGQRFQNYRATFTILDVPVVSRAWIADLASGNSLGMNAPSAWSDWVKTGRYRALTAEPTTVIRSMEQQTPDTPLKRDILRCVWLHFKDSPIAFEGFAAHLYGMLDARVVIDEVTRASVDGGRDAVGRYLLGLPDDPVYAEFSLEAKCYRPPAEGETPNTVGVKEVSRLISRIRHRQFGVLVTTSIVARQAYEEVREDRHPIVFIAGRDISEILIANGFNTVERVSNLLQNEFRVG